MRFSRNAKPELCVSDDTTREICNLHLDTDASVLVSTDGYRMAVVPVTLDEGDTSGAVSADAIRLARKASGKNGDTYLGANGAYTMNGGIQAPRAAHAYPFPAWENITGDLPQKAMSVSFNADMLLTLAKAIGAARGVVTLELSSDPLDPIKVIGSDTAAFGVLMPCRP